MTLQRVTRRWSGTELEPEPPMHPFTIAVKKSSKNFLLPPFLYIGCIVLGMKIKEPTCIILGLEGITPG
jgi:hypothetical protein